MDPLTLPALLGIVTAFLLDQDRPEQPAGGEVGGLSDIGLWEIIRDDGDIFTEGGMSFDEAVVADPRRIDALIQQRILNEFYTALDVLRGAETDDSTRHVFLLQYDTLRQLRGGVTAEGIADVYEQMWGYYSQVLDAGAAMRREGVPAERVWDAIARNRDPIQQAFRESGDIALRASRVPPNEDEAAAWSRIAGIIDNMSTTLDNKLIQLQLVPGEIAEIEGPAEDEEYGAWEPEWSQYQLSGHRARGLGLDQWRRSGGRFY